jgi:hypothetical protein
MRLFDKTAVVGLAAAALLACNKMDKGKSAQSKTREEDRVGTQAAGDTAAGRHEFIEKMKLELDTLGTKIDALKARSAKASEKSKAEMKRQIVALDEKRDKLTARLDTLGRSTASAWNDLKAGTQKQVDSLKAAVNRLKKKEKS